MGCVEPQEENRAKVAKSNPGQVISVNNKEDEGKQDEKASDQPTEKSEPDEAQAPADETTAKEDQNSADNVEPMPDFDVNKAYYKNQRGNIHK